MIPTTTGAAKAVSLVLPELTGKLNGLAIRVPTPNVSLVDLVATIEKSGITVSEVNAALKNAAQGELAGVLAAVGLAQNYGACLALSTVGIQKGQAPAEFLPMVELIEAEIASRIEELSSADSAEGGE